MTIRAIAGLVAFNTLVFVIGAALLWGGRAWRSWAGLMRLGGVAYLTGVAALVVALTLELVLGIPIGGVTIVATVLGLATAGALVGRRMGNRWLRLPLGGWRLPRLTLLGALFAASIAVYLQALFRSARLQPLAEWDAWWVWTLKAKALYFFGDLGGEAFVPSGPGGAYPPGLPLLESAAFHAMGSADVVTLHLQYWFLSAGFVAALLGLLAGRVRQTILLPLVVLTLVMPSLTDRITDGRADVPLAYLLAIGSLLLVLWLEERHGWHLAAATVFLASAMLTKREGILLAACIAAAAFAASWGDRRRAWPKLALASFTAFALPLPWRIWFSAQGFQSDAPTTGYLGFLDQLDRAVPSLRLTLRTFFDYDLWLLLPALAIVAALLAALAAAARIAAFIAVFFAASTIACAWVIWSNPEYEITQDYGLTPIVRLVGDAVLVLAAVTPLALERAWSGGNVVRSRGLTSAVESSTSRRRRWFAWGVVLVAAMCYPASMLAGTTALRLPGGLPSFPSPSECVLPVAEGQGLRVVLGYVDTYREASSLRARTAGLPGPVGVEQDGCGRLRVFVDGISSLEAAAEVAARAESLGLEPTLERDPRR